jgi:hypothetical protein
MNKSVFLVLALLLSACTEIIGAQKLTFDTSSNIVDLSKEVNGKWDRVCILTPYSTNQYAEKVLGFKFDVETKTDIFSSDGISLLIFANDNNAIQYYEVPRNNVDFSSLDTSCYKHDSAKFKLNKKANGWVSVQHT